jgi:hypothetical protein
MKIIATTPEGYLVEAEAEELSNLMGYRSEYHRRHDKRSDRPLHAGDNIPISKMYDRLYRMANMEKELTEISAKLKTASDFINTALPTIQHINKEE